MLCFVAQPRFPNLLDESIVCTAACAALNWLLRVVEIGDFYWCTWWWQSHFPSTNNHLDMLEFLGRWLGTARDCAWLRVTSRDCFYECMQKLAYISMNVLEKWVHSRNLEWLRVTPAWLPRDSRVTSRDFAICAHGWASGGVFFQSCTAFWKIYCQRYVQRGHKISW